MLAPLFALALDGPALAAGDAAASKPPVAAPAPVKPRGEILVAVGAAAGTSNWSGDPVGYGGLRLGLRLFRIVTPFVEGRLGYGRVDQRLLTMLSIGVEAGGYVQERFFLRGYLAFVHQHEESIAAVAEEPFGAVLGIGVGIRHRAGAQIGAGFDVVVHRGARYDLTIGPELTSVFLTYSSGPSWYGLIGVAGRAHFHLF